MASRLRPVRIQRPHLPCHWCNLVDQRDYPSSRYQAAAQHDVVHENTGKEGHRIR